MTGVQTCALPISAVDALSRPSISLSTFSDAIDSIDAAVAILFGEQEARGRLPLRISEAYPFGFGLTSKRQES